MDDCVGEICGLTIIRGGNEILHDLDIALSEGVITGLLGPSGCGKTTLMRAIVGTQRITSGEIRILGHRAGTRALRTQVGYSSQQASVYPDLSARENLRYFATVLGAPAHDAERVLAQVELDSVADRVTGALSGGQRSRVSLAVAMLGSPRLLVLDEPTVGLDPVLRNELWGLFRQLVDAGASLLVSSHVMDEAERCDSLILMRDGVVLTHETPDGLKERTGAATVEDAFLRLVATEKAAA